MSDVTRVLNSCAPDNPRAAEELLPLVYEELRRLAAAKMAREKPGQTIQATALVHEAWLCLTNNDGTHYKDRQHFFRTAAEVMRRILVDRARRRKTVKHGGGQQRVELDAIQIPAENDDLLLSVNESLEELAKTDPEKAEVVKLRFFVGLTEVETADLLGASPRTVRRHWTYAKAWLSKVYLENR